MKAFKAKQLLATAKDLETDIAAFNALQRKIKNSGGIPMPLDLAIPERDESAAELFTRLQILTSAISSVSPTAVLLANTQLDSLKAGFETLRNLIHTAMTALSDEKGANNIDPNTLLLTFKDGSTFDLRPVFQQLYDGVERILSDGLTNILVSKSRHLTAFSALSGELTGLAKDTRAIYDNLARDLASAKEAMSTLQKAQSEVAARAQEVSRLSEQAQNDRKSIQEYASESSGNLAISKQVAQEAKAVEAQVSSYKATFEGFQASLDTRAKEIESGRKSLDELIGAYNEQKEQTAELIDRSEKMLSLTTTAGLASHYLSKSRDLTTDLFWARVSFYAGIAILFLSAAPLFAQTLVPFIGLFSEKLGSNIFAQSLLHPTADRWQYVMQTAGRIILLVPGAWLIQFASKRHGSLFKLREQYAYKYALAASVEGFKKEAPDFGDKIAFDVFERLARNPADDINQKALEAKAPGFLHSATNWFHPKDGEKPG